MNENAERIVKNLRRIAAIEELLIERENYRRQLGDCRQEL